MSGLCGLVRFDDLQVLREDLDRQLKALAILGPDRAQASVVGSAGLGALLMEATREDAFDDQPMSDPDGAWVMVCDARIDNREAIAKALSIDDAALARMADSALVFAAWCAWGPACADRLIGDFAFAAWDRREEVLTLARDHMGQRPLFYYRGPEFLAFATLKTGLWALPEVPRILPEREIARMLLMDLREAPATQPAEGFGAVPGGCILTVDRSGTLCVHRYWSPRPAPEHLGQDEAYYLKTYREVLGEAVACRVRRAPRPAGLLMGGGFDSTAICGFAAPAAARQGLPFVAVTSVAPDGYGDEAKSVKPWAEAARRHIPNLDVRYADHAGTDIFTDLEQTWLATGAAASPTHYATSALFRVMAEAGCRVAMDGHGGDYTLNPRGHGALSNLLAKGRLRSFWREWRARRRFLRTTHWDVLERHILLRSRIYRWWRRVRSGDDWTKPALPVSSALMRAAGAWNIRLMDSSPRPPRKAMERVLRSQQNADWTGYALPAARHGLVFTLPFHDKRVIELGLAIPEELHVVNGRERHLARTALKDLYPPEFQDRGPGNHHMAPDFQAMLRRIGPKLDAEIDWLDRSGAMDRYLDFRRMRRMLALAHRGSGRRDGAYAAALVFIRARYIAWFRGVNG